MDRTELVLGRGEVYFDRFIPGTRTGEGERYIGNTTSFQIERRLEHVESRSSFGGVAVRNFRTPTSENTVITFISDHISADNAADWLGASVTQLTEASVPQQTETHTLRAGGFYQLGLSLQPGIGVRNLFATVVSVAGEVLSGIYLDENNGRFGIPASRTDLNGLVATVTYEVRSNTNEKIETASKVVRGSLRFISRNAHGKNKNYFIPHVLLSPKDQMNLKGDEWLSLTFEADVLSSMVVYESGVADTSLAEDAILDEGTTLESFPLHEDILHVVVNLTIPSRGY